MLEEIAEALGPEGKHVLVDEPQNHTLRANPRKSQCQVEGCRISLPKHRAYHKRYRICSYHASLPQMVLDGRHVRFCQQCGRFQALVDFDGSKRSCRAKLDLHNARRKQAREAAARGVAASPSPSPSSAVPSASDTFTSDAEVAGGANSDYAPAYAAPAYTLSPMGSGALPAAAVAAPALAPPPMDASVDLERLLDEIDMDVALSGDAEFFDCLLEAPLAPVDLIPARAVAPPAPPAPALMPPAAAGSGASMHPSFLAAEALMATAAPPLRFEPAADLVRTSFKLFNVHPSELPPSIFSELQNMLNSVMFPMHNVRLGCTYLTLETLATAEEAAELRARGSKGLLEAAVARGPAVFPPSTFQGPNGRVLAQLGEDVSVVSGQVAVTVRLGVDSLTTPRVSSVVPFAAVPGARRGFTLLGARVAGGQDMVVCRRGAAMPDLEVVRSGAVSGGGEEFVEFVVPRLLEGLHFVEVQRGALLSGAAPFLVVDDAGAVAELRQLEYDASGVGDGAAVAAFLRSVGVVLDWRRRQSPDAAGSTSVGLSEYSLGRTDGPETTARIAAVAQRVVATCVARGWPALLRLVLPAAVAPGASAAEALEAIKSLSAEGFSLLHLVATSRCASTVAVLAEWAASLGHAWRCEAAGPSALTPLHLSALLNDEGAMASALTALFPDGASLWLHQSPACPHSPAAFAVMVRNAPVMGWLEKNGVPCRAMADPAAWKLADAAPAPVLPVAQRSLSCKDGRSLLDGRWASVDAMVRQVEAAAWQNPRGLASLAVQGGCLAVAAGLALYLRVCQAAPS